MAQDAALKRLDARLDGLAAVVKLEHLVEREGGWGATASWGDTMSLGDLHTPPSARDDALHIHAPMPAHAACPSAACEAVCPEWVGGGATFWIAKASM